MLLNININKTNNKNNKSRPQRTYFWVYNIYQKQVILSWLFFLESFASHKLTKLRKNLVFTLGPLTLYFLLLLLSFFLFFSYPYFFLFSVPYFFCLFWTCLREGIYRVLGGLESIYDLLILRGVLWALDKDPIRSLWTQESQIDFCKSVALLGMIDLSYFKASSERFWHHHCLRPPKLGRGDAHLSFESNFSQVKGV